MAARAGGEAVPAARGRGGAPSFQRKGPPGGSRLAAIAGTRPAVRHGQLLLSTGLPSLDSVLGWCGAGSEEDKYGVYSHLLFKYFLAEGVVCGHDLFVASAKELPTSILKELPAPLLDNCRNEVGEEAAAVKSEDDSMQIAWRYQNLPKMEVNFDISLVSVRIFSLYVTLSARKLKFCVFFLNIAISSILKCVVKHFLLANSNMNCGYARLLQSIQKIIYQEGFDGSHPQKKQKNILRIGIQSLGSMLWDDDICCTENPENAHSITKFLYVLRGLLRKSLSACIITVPAHLIQNKAIMERVTNLSDVVVGLESFIGSERETNPLYKDYHGLIHVRQIPRLNCLICDVSDTKDLAFRLKRKQFTIEVRETVLLHSLEPKRWIMPIYGYMTRHILKLNDMTSHSS
uniref:Elongator complex protein 4 n=1 Tax=Nothoprocta perdicaria TaxID=30464 RepID=A0A8C6ZDL7_NOTPE